MIQFSEIVSVTTSAFVVVGCLFNAATIAIFSLGRMKSPVRIIFLLIGVADLANCLLCSLRLYGDDVQTINIIYEYGGPFSRTLSVWFECLLTTVQLVAVTYPLKCHDWCGPGRIRIIGLIGCFALSFLTSIALICYFNFDQTPLFQRIPLVIAYVLVSNALPCLIMVVTGAVMVFTVNRNSIRPESTEESRRLHARCSRSTKVILYLASLSMFSEIYQLVFTLYKWSIHFKTNASDENDYFYLIVITLEQVNVSIKFLLYYRFDRRFRDAVKDLLLAFGRRFLTYCRQLHQPTV